MLEAGSAGLVAGRGLASDTGPCSNTHFVICLLVLFGAKPARCEHLSWGSYGCGMPGDHGLQSESATTSARRPRLPIPISCRRLWGEQKRGQKRPKGQAETERNSILVSPSWGPLPSQPKTLLRLALSDGTASPFCVACHQQIRLQSAIRRRQTRRLSSFGVCVCSQHIYPYQPD